MRACRAYATALRESERRRREHGPSPLDDEVTPLDRAFERGEDLYLGGDAERRRAFVETLRSLESELAEPEGEDQPDGDDGPGRRFDPADGSDGRGAPEPSEPIARDS